MKKILAIVLVLLAGCKKQPVDDDYTITTVVVDWDAQTAIAGAKVYSNPVFLPSNPNTATADSGLTDASGTIVFTHPRDQVYRTVYVKKDGYDYPVYSTIYIAPLVNQDRLDTFFLAKASYLDLQLHRANTYISGDILEVTIEGYRKNKFVFNGNVFSKVGVYGLPRNAIAADSTVLVPSVYFPPPYQKAYVNWRVNRNGLTVANGVDSTDLIQYGTKGFVLNY